LKRSDNVKILNKIKNHNRADQIGTVLVTEDIRSRSFAIVMWPDGACTVEETRKLEITKDAPEDHKIPDPGDLWKIK